MVRRSHRGGLGRASFSGSEGPYQQDQQRTRGGAARWNTGTQRGACDGRGRGLGEQRNAHLIPPLAGGTQEPGLRLVRARHVGMGIIKI